MPLRGVIFDMGGTLLHYNAPGTTWQDSEKTGARGIYRYLASAGFALPPEDDALDTAWRYMIGVWTRLDAFDPQDLKLRTLVTALLRQWGIGSPSPETVTGAVEAYMTAIQNHVVPLDGAVQTLRAVRDSGLRIGLISNTFWPSAAHRYDLERHGLAPFLEHMVFSADAEVWKPHAEVFQLGLDALDLQPEETAYVGDSLFFDVWGAQCAGLRGVWIEQPHGWLPDGIDVTPDATIATLPALLEIVQSWS